MRNGERSRNDWDRCRWYVQDGTEDRKGTDRRDNLGANAQGNGTQSKLSGTKGEMVQGDRERGKSEGVQSVITLFDVL